MHPKRRPRRNSGWQPVRVEGLEPRRLFAAPDATNLSYTLNEDGSLTTQSAADSLHIDGDGLLFVGSQTFTRSTGGFGVNLRSDGSVRADYADNNYPTVNEWWSIFFAPPTNQTLAAGNYPPAFQYPHQTSVSPGIDVQGDDHGYNSVHGQFNILQLVSGGGTVSRFAADFSLSTGLTGTIRFHYNTGLLANAPVAASLTAAVAAGPSHGSLNVNPDGTFSYMPSADFFGTDSFTYTLSDGVAPGAPATVTLDVQPVNDPPTFTIPDSVTSDEDAGPLAINFATALSPGPGETDQTLSFTFTDNSNPSLFSSGPTIDPVTGKLSFTTTPNAHGVAALTVVATDSGGASSAPQTFTLTVNNTPDAPAAKPDRYDLSPNVPFRPDPTTPLTYLYVTGDAADPITHGQSYFFTPATAVFNVSRSSVTELSVLDTPQGAWFLDFAGSQFYGPIAPGDYANASITGTLPYVRVVNSTSGYFSQVAGSFVVSADDLAAGRGFEVDFVQHVNGSSAALYGSIRYHVIQGSLLANDVSENSAPLTAVLYSLPAHGTISLSADGFFTYTPNPGFTGTDSFTYAASDGTLTGTAATVTLNVLPDLATTIATGTLLNQYVGPDGAPTTTPLAGWRVYDDANDNFTFDAGESNVITDLDGDYALPLTGSRFHSVRVAEHAGWSVPAGRFDYASVAVSLAGAATAAVATFYTSMSHPVVVDVVAFYPGTAATADWVNTIRGYFRTANSVYANSDTNVLINLVDAHPVNYTSAGNLNTDLDRLSNPSDGALDAATIYRDQIGADVGVLFDPSSATNQVGLAYVLDPTQVDSRYGFAVVARTGDDRYDGLTLAHEIGHTLGAGHDVANGPAQIAIPYARGYRFTGDDGVLYHDVMAYDPGTVLPFFSSPLLSYAGEPLGTTTADNAREIREYAYLVASYRGTKVDPPPVVTPPTKPTVQPIATTATSTATAKAAVRPGTVIPLAATIRNTSNKNYTGKATVAFYLSKDKTLDADDTLLKRVTLNAKNLKPKLTLATSTTCKLPTTKAADTYYLLAVATTTAKPTDERAAKPTVTTVKIAAPPKKPGVKPKAIFLAARISPLAMLLFVRKDSDAT